MPKPDIGDEINEDVNFGCDRKRQRSVVLDAIMLKNLKKKSALPSLEEGQFDHEFIECS